jgi:hypothetical protein
MDDFSKLLTDYVARGWWILPIDHRRKAPILPGWTKLRITQEQLPRYFPDAKPRNIGVLLGIPCNQSELSIIDIDIDLPEVLCDADTILPPTDFIFGRQSKPRSHRFYLTANPQPSERLSISKKITLVEYRGAGGQTVIPGSIHPSGEIIEAEATGTPAVIDGNELLEAVRKLARAHGWGGDARQELPPVKPATPVEITDNDRWQRCQAYLSCLPDSISGQRGHDKLFQAACECFRFGLNSSDTRGMLTWFNETKCRPKWRLKEIEHKIVDAAVKVSGEGQIGCRIPAMAALPSFSGVQEKARVASASPEFPEDLLSPPGILGDICNWMVSTSLKPQPVLALANTLSFLGAIFGRKIRMSDDTRTNLYTVGLAPSGSGKEHSRKCCYRITEACGLTEQVIGPEEISSATALVRILQNHPSTLLLFDEVGHLLGISGHWNAQSHLKEIPVTLTKLFSRANGTYGGKQYATADAVPLFEPNLCLYGTTVASRLYEGLTKGQIEDGFAARVLFFSVPEAQWDVAERKNDPTDVPQSIVDTISQWWFRNDLERTSVLNGKLRPHVVPCSPDAEAARLDWRAKWRPKKQEARLTGFDALWARAEEHACKCALICAAGTNFEAPIITDQIMDWACRLSDHCLKSFEINAQENIVDSEYGRCKKRIYHQIKRCPDGISRHNLTRATQGIPSRLRKEILDDLTESEVISVAQIATDGRPNQQFRVNLDLVLT